MKQKIQILLNQLNHGLVERKEAINIALLTVLAGENLVLIGPPGTGKSLIARRIAKSFEHSGDNDYFEYLLTKFSTPEEIFGPLSITELKADRFKRNTEGYLPTVKIAFLDEIFKASSSILNALLTILNERIYHNGAEREGVELQALIAASNELPIGQEELNALYDRFLVRSFVDYVSQDNLPRLFEKTEEPELSKLTEADLKEVKEKAKAVTLPPDIVDAIQRIWQQHKETFKEDRRESLSDRRLKKVIEMLRVSAATNGRSQVDLSDVLLLKDCLWNHQENAIKVRDLILKNLQTFSSLVLQNEDTVKVLLPSPDQAGAKLNAMVSGLKGRGTEQDPILIETVAELMDLSRPEVGMKGYYFRQTADIDCSVLSSWTNISFKGHYVGGGYTVKHKRLREAGVSALMEMKGDDVLELFSSIRAQSSITNLNLEDLRLATNAEDSHISCCFSTVDLIKNKATNCTITSCLTGNSLISRTATNCKIAACESGAFLIGETATNCGIRDCLVVLDMDWNVRPDAECGGIAVTLANGSVVERCFVMGKVRNSGNGGINFSGIARDCHSAIIRKCALGRLQLGRYSHLQNRITSDVKKLFTLEKNASIDSNKGTDEINGRDGKAVAAALFKQHYFQHTLGWDFDTVWQWDDANDRPALRSVGVGATLQRTKSADQNNNMTDLLTQQMRANIWL